ncbi:hypothetical protein MSPP1_000988 [Malassezia sp. CBS 17886]|nr:hypothetical protein MSPP1_000988 [Malassezia sp. CBS 17886]
MVAALPPELLEHVWLTLDPASVDACMLVCRGAQARAGGRSLAAWHAHLAEDAFWRRHAVAHRRIPPGCADMEAARAHRAADARRGFVSSPVPPLTCFRRLCYALWNADCGWGRTNVRRGVEPRVLVPRTHRYTADGVMEHVWRIKLDPVDGCIIVTDRLGGVRTIDADTGAVLWRLRSNETAPFPHLEYSDGHMVLSAWDGTFDVWRSERLGDLGGGGQGWGEAGGMGGVEGDEDGGVGGFARGVAGGVVGGFAGDIAGNAPRGALRGAFRRQRPVDIGRPSRAFRFQYPTLFCYSADDFVTEYNITSRTTVAAHSVAHTQHRENNVNYIDFDDDFFFLVGDGGGAVSIFSRRSGDLLWTLYDHIAQHGDPPTFSSAAAPTSRGAFVPLRVVGGARYAYTGPKPGVAESEWHPWFGVHPDDDTQTLVVLGQSGLLFLRNYASVLPGHPGAPSLFFYAFPRGVARWPHEDAWSSRATRRPETWTVVDDLPGYLSVANGRVAAVYVGAACVQMDQSGIYCVTTQESADAIRYGYTPEHDGWMHGGSTVVTGWLFARPRGAD